MIQNNYGGISDMDVQMNDLLMFSKTKAYLNEEFEPSDFIESIKEHLNKWNNVAMSKVGNITHTIEDGKLISTITTTNEVLEQDISLDMKYLDVLKEHIIELNKEVEERSTKYPNIPKDASDKFIEKLNSLSRRLVISVNSLYPLLLFPLNHNEKVSNIIEFVEESTIDELVEIVNNNILYKCINNSTNKLENGGHSFWLSYMENESIFSIRRNINLKGVEYVIEDNYFINMADLNIRHINNKILLKQKSVNLTIENNGDFDELISKGNIITPNNLEMTYEEFIERQNKYDEEVIKEIGKLRQVMNFINTFTNYTSLYSTYYDTSFKYYSDRLGEYHLESTILFNKQRITFPNDTSNKYKLKLLSNFGVTLSTEDIETLTEYHKYLYHMYMNKFHITDVSKLLDEVSKLKSMEQYVEDGELVDFPIKDSVLYVGGNVQLSMFGQKKLNLLIKDENGEKIYQRNVDLAHLDVFTESMELLNI